MRIILAALAVLLAGCNPAGAGEPERVWYSKQFDPEHNVVCYKTAGGNLSCVYLGSK